MSKKQERAISTGNKTSSFIRSIGKAEKIPVFPGPATTISSVAVVITCHNYGRYLRQCVDSVLEQTHKPDSVVVVDDASDDYTKGICEQYKSKGVAYLRTEFRDVAKARNAGAASCRSTGYILFVDADNWLPSNYIESLLSGMTSQSIGVTYCHLRIIDDEGRDRGRLGAIAEFSKESLSRSNIADTCSLVRRQAFDQVRGWSSSKYGLHDWELWLRIVDAGWKMKLVNETELNYRKHKGQMTDIRSGDYGCFPHTMSNASMTTIVTLFSGREWMLRRWFDCLMNQEWNKENLHVVAVDNSGVIDFSQRLRDHLDLCGITHTYIKDYSKVDSTILSRDLADSAGDRIKNNLMMNIHLGRLYSLAGRYIPASSRFVWSIEDDVLCDTWHLNELSKELFRVGDAGAVSGLIKSRFEGNGDTFIAFNNGVTIRDPGNDTIEVESTGMYCMLMRRSTWDAIAWRPGITMIDAHPYYDWAVCHDIRERVGKVYSVGKVRCGHAQKDGTILI